MEGKREPAFGLKGDHRGFLPKVSVVTPSFNQGRFLEQTIRSVLGQDYPNLEYIVMDGGSTDGSVDVIRKYAHRLAYWVSQPDRGQADAIERGLRLSTGGIIAYLNSDDLYLPGAISRVVDAFRRYPDVDLIYGDVFIIGENGEVLSERRLTTLDQYDFLGLGDCLAQPAVFWRRKIYEQVGGINPRYYFQMDLDFFIRVSAAGRMRHMKSFLAKIRMQPDGKMLKAEHVRRAELAALQRQYIDVSGLERLLYNRKFLWARLFVRYALQGDIVFAARKVWRRLVDEDLFRDSRG